MLKVNRGLLTIIDGDAAGLICQAVSQRDEAFFKAFCKTLTGQKFNPGGWDNYNLAIARLIYDGNTESGRKKLKKRLPAHGSQFPCLPRAIAERAAAKISIPRSPEKTASAKVR